MITYKRIVLVIYIYKCSSVHNYIVYKLLTPFCCMTENNFLDLYRVQESNLEYEANRVMMS